MARTRSEQYPENQQRILDEAARLFASRGFPRTSIAELARACGASKAWLYHYYESKEAILFAMLDAHTGELLRVSREALASADEPEAQFRAFVRANIEIYVRAPEKHVVLINDLDCLPPEQAEEIRESERRLVEMVADLLARLNPALAHHPMLRKPYAMMFYGLINWTYIWYDPAGEVEPQQLSRLAADLFLNGFLSAPRQ
jgi:AcrR family transcriptional regulator